MPVLAATYVSEVADGRVPSAESPEARAYQEWSKDQTVREIVLGSCLKIYGPGYFLLGSMI
jgi:hypothetical protein